MRLRERDKQKVSIYPWLGERDDGYEWGEPQIIRAAVYPMGESVSTSAYGERIKDSRLMLYDGKEEIKVGMGISLDGDQPAYRVINIERWSGHMRAVLERIAEGRQT